MDTLAYSQIRNIAERVRTDRVTVFRISKDGADVEKNALELLLG